MSVLPDFSRRFTGLRVGLSLAGFVAALLAVALEDRRLTWAAIALLAGSLIVRLLQGRDGPRCDPGHMARARPKLVCLRPADCKRVHARGHRTRCPVLPKRRRGGMRVPKAVARLLALGLMVSASALHAQGAEFSLGGGIANPLGTFNDATKLGWMGLAAVSFVPTGSPVGFQIDGQYHQYPFDGFSGHERFLIGTGNVVTSSRLPRRVASGPI